MKTTTILPPDSPFLENDEVIYEFTPLGASVKVSAIHAKTGLEACIIAPINSSRYSQQQCAFKKLCNLLKHGDKKEEKPVSSNPKNTKETDIVV